MGSYLSTCIQSYKNDNKKQAIIVWDIENIQPPNISIHDLISYIRLKFITKCGYIEHSTICSLTNISIKKLDASTLDELISVATCILLASTYSKKRDADFVLLRELMRFISHNNPKQSKIILITSDSDYSGITNMALQQNFDFQLIYRNDCGKQLLALPYINKPILWDDLVIDVNNGIKPEMIRIHHKEKIDKKYYKCNSTQTNMISGEIKELIFEYNYDVMDLKAGIYYSGL